MDGIAQLALTLAVGTVASFAVFKLSVLLYERVKSPLLNPLLVTVAFIIAALVALRIPLDSYEQSVQLISVRTGHRGAGILGVPAAPDAQGALRSHLRGLPCRLGGVHG